MKMDSASIEESFFDISKTDINNLEIYKNNGGDFNNCMLDLTISI